MLNYHQKRPLGRCNIRQAILVKGSNTKIHLIMGDMLPQGYNQIIKGLLATAVAHPKGGNTKKFREQMLSTKDFQPKISKTNISMKGKQKIIGFLRGGVQEGNHLFFIYYYHYYYDIYVKVVVSNIFYFHPLFGEDFHFDEHIFQMG